MKIEDAIRRYESWAEDDRIDLRIRKEHEQIAEWLKELQRLRPLADRPQGQWIDRGDHAECSNCGANSGTQYDGVEPIPLKTNFCPHCGAHMKGIDNETD